MPRFPVAFGVLLGALGAGLMGLALRPAFAQSPRAATCVSFVNNFYAGNGQKRLEEDKSRIVVNHFSIAAAYETWFTQQLSEGKTHFITTHLGETESLACAW